MTTSDEFSTETLGGRNHIESLVRNALQRASCSNALQNVAAIRSVGIVGAGVMGTAMAAAAAAAGMDVVITDTDADVLSAAKTTVVNELGKNRISLSSEESSDAPIRRQAGHSALEAQRIARLRVRCTSDVAAAAACDLVLESVAENPKIKQELYARIEPLMSESAVLGSNTSTIPIGELAASLKRPQRFCGVHFFHPVRQRPMVEIIRGPRTSLATTDAVRGFSAALGKLPIELSDGPGFLVNRLLLPYASEAMELLLDGADIYSVETAAERFGMAKGPLRLLDEIGLDTVLRGGWVLSSAFPDRTVSSPLLVGMIKAGNVGMKSGAGFFRHISSHDNAEAIGKNKPLGVAPGVAELIARWRREPITDRPVPSFDDSAILERLLLPMVLEATRLLEDATVASHDQIDLATVFALGFPIQRGGLWYWSESLGAGRIVAMLARLEHLGTRMKPTKMLLQMAAAGPRRDA